MQRRDFITLFGGAVAAWPLAARSQQVERLRRIGVLMAFDENDPEPKAWLSGFMQGLADLGWTDGRNLGMDVRWAAGNLERMCGCSRKSWSIFSQMSSSQTRL
jgi:putative ABC transport system substrate-binding protein